MMANITQYVRQLLRRGTQAQVIAASGASGELFYATDYPCVYISSGANVSPVSGLVPCVVITAARTIVPSDMVLVCNSAGGFTQTLPAATGSGRLLHIKNIASGAIVVDGNASETIDGATTQTVNQYESLQIVDYATGVWAIV